MRLGQLKPDLGIRRLAGADPGGAGLGLLLGHGGVKALHIHRPALFAQGILRQIQGEAEGVIELERRPARQIAAFGQVRQFVIQQLQAAIQRGLELGFFQLQRLFDQGLRAGQVRDKPPPSDAPKPAPV